MARVQERFRERGRRKVGRKRKRRRKLNSSVNMKLTGWKKERSASRVSLVLLPDSFPELRRKDIEENSDRTGKSRIVETARLKSVVAALYARYSFNFSNPHTCLTQKSVGARIEMVHASYLYDESGQEGRDECVRTHRSGKLRPRLFLAIEANTNSAASSFSNSFDHRKHRVQTPGKLRPRSNRTGIPTNKR